MQRVSSQVCRENVQELDLFKNRNDRKKVEKGDLFQGINERVKTVGFPTHSKSSESANFNAIAI